MNLKLKYNYNFICCLIVIVCPGYNWARGINNDFKPLSFQERMQCQTSLEKVY